MAGWAGFSDEELRRLKQRDQAEPVVSGRGRRPASTNRSRQQLQRERALHTAAQQQGSGPLPPEQRLTKPEVQRSSQAPSQVPPRPAETKECPQRSTSDEQPTANSQPVPNTETAPMVKELEKQEVELREKTRLELLQQEQRMIEEKNKRKKALLAKTLAEKSKRTQAEAVKLKRIQKELQALDDMVSNDIGILRGRIEQASWDYSVARKRYNKAEAEYVEAKLDLHRKTEVKEQLTEHLCAIIQENERRKARKLEELMQQLELQADEEGLELEIQVERMLREQEEAERREVEQEEAAHRALGKGRGQDRTQPGTVNGWRGTSKVQRRSAGLARPLPAQSRRGAVGTLRHLVSPLRLYLRLLFLYSETWARSSLTSLLIVHLARHREDLLSDPCENTTENQCKPTCKITLICVLLPESTLCVLSHCKPSIILKS